MKDIFITWYKVLGKRGDSFVSLSLLLLKSDDPEETKVKKVLTEINS
jgi:hypothetical protein